VRRPQHCCRWRTTSRARWLTANVSYLAAAVLLLPGTVAPLHLLRARGALLGHVGGALYLFGLAGLLAWTTLNFVSTGSPQAA
jgi:hypothetical protein